MTTKPKLVVFDLDGCLWLEEMYMTAGAPFSDHPTPHACVDRNGDIVQLAPGSLVALQTLVTDDAWKDTKIGLASRTHYPKWALECLKLITVNINGEEKTVHSLCSFFEIYPSNKTKHFAKLKKDSGLEFNEMVFFDNESRNIRDVSALGVRCFYAPEAMTKEVWFKMVQFFE